MMKRKSLMPLIGVGLLLTLVSGCAGDNDTTTDPGSPTTSSFPSGSPAIITVNLKNWAVEPSSPTVKAGKVTFRAVHEEQGHGGGHGAGTAGSTHQLVVARLEDGADVGRTKFGPPVLNLADIGVGKEKAGEVELEPGRYELACLVVEQVDGESVNHYNQGMYALLVVG